MKTRRRICGTRRLLALLATLETPCTDCEYGTVDNTDAVEAWKQRLNELVPPGSSSPNSYTTTGQRYYRELQAPPPERVTCPTCSGKAVALTEAGRAVAEFLTRHGIGGAL